MPEPQQPTAEPAAPAWDAAGRLVWLLAQREQSAAAEAARKREARAQVVSQRAAERRAAYRAAAQEREATQGREAEQAVGAATAAAGEEVADVPDELALSRQLVQTSNMAAAALETHTAFSKATQARLWTYDQSYFREQTQLDRDQYVARMLAAAGHGPLDALTDLFLADSLWERLGASERTLSLEVGARPDPFRTRMELAELLTQHLPDVLVSLGYTPPPPAADWAGIVRDSMQVVLESGQDPAAVAGNAERARQELAFFNQRLRVIVEEAERAQGGEGADAAGQSQLPRLRAAVSAARGKAVPAALAAGASAAFAGMAAGPAVMGIALLSGSIASLAASATEAAATAMLAEHGPLATATSSAQLARADLNALDDCVELLRSAGPATLERVCFIIRRGVFQTLQDCAVCSFPVRHFLWEEWSRAFLRRLDSGELSADDAHLLVNGARLAVTRQTG